MNASEAVKLVGMLKAAYPRAEINAETTRIYCEMLADLDASEATNAVKHLLATSKFFPSIAEIRAMLATRQEQLPASEAAWGEVRKAISSQGRYRTPQFSHPAISHTVDVIGWETICSSEAIGVERAHFLRCYEDYCARHVQAAQLGRLLPTPEPRKALGEPQQIGTLLKLPEVKS